MHSLTFNLHIFPWNVPLVSLIFLTRSLVFSILLFSSISLHWTLRRAFFISPCLILDSFSNMKVLEFPKEELAAAAKSLQSCPTLCNPIDGSPPGSPIPGILQARTLEWVAISFSNTWKWKVKVKSLSHVHPKYSSRCVWTLYMFWDIC